MEEKAKFLLTANLGDFIEDWEEQVTEEDEDDEEVRLSIVRSLDVLLTREGVESRILRRGWRKKRKWRGRV